MRGVGDSEPQTTNLSDRGEYSTDYFYSSHALMLDYPYIGQRTFDVLRVLDWLNAWGYGQVHLAAKGYGALPSTFAALLSSHVVQVTLKNALSSYAEVAEARDYRWPLSALPPGVLNSFDLPDCYRELKKKNVRLVNHGAQTRVDALAAALLLAMLVRAASRRPAQASPAQIYSARQVGAVVELMAPQPDGGPILPGSAISRGNEGEGTHVLRFPFNSAASTRGPDRSHSVPCAGADRLDEPAFYANGKRYAFDMSLGTFAREPDSRISLVRARLESDRDPRRWTVGVGHQPTRVLQAAIMDEAVSVCAHHEMTHRSAAACWMSPRE